MIFGPLDRWCIKAVEKIAQKIQKITGKNNFFYAKALNIIGFLLGTPVLVITNSYMNNGPIPVWLPEAFICISLVFSLIHFLDFWLFKVEEKVLSQSIKGLSNYRKKDRTISLFRELNYYMMLKLIILFSFFPGLSGPALLLLYVIQFLVEILLACDPLPQCRGKIMEWLDSKKTVLAPTQATTEAAFRSL